ncbi:putative porin [Paracrocinitomix mangrovi]|uniref:putative porin n=1 Tax=Paracrocinitomix mangrovi TaxID=2862509 RepID=UPI001EDC24F5|nr:putative porin [Paracrocinitomix mangrovi]UKN02344.1 putative porin [Paracrocinitomix mangrovi]
MKNIIFSLILMSIGTFSIGQNFLNKFSEKSGLIWDMGSKLDYNVNDSRFSLTINEDWEAKNSKKPIANNHIFEVDLGYSMSKSVSKLFSKGGYAPGFDGSILYGFEFELDKGGYVYPFARIGYENTRNTFAFNDTSIASNVYRTNKETEHLFGMNGGITYGITEDLFISISGGYYRTSNWEGDLDLSQLNTVVAVGVDTSGKSITVTSSEEVYFGRSISNANLGKMQFDFFTRPIRFKKEGLPSIGLIVSTVAKFRQNKTPRYDLTFGPTFHVPTTTEEMNRPDILASLLFQWSDLYQGIPYKTIWNKKFGINVVVGIPFSVFKFK